MWSQKSQLSSAPEVGFSGCNEGSIKGHHKKGTKSSVCSHFFLPAILTLVPYFPDSSLTKVSPCSEAGKPCNPCLDAAKACNLNETCKRLRSAYNSICSKAVPPQSSLANQEPCSRKRCQKALRQFFERVSWELSYPLLFCSCPDQACAERRRRTIVPSCSHQERHKPSCLELRHTCRSDALCRSRLADFHMNCQMTPHTVTSCPHDNYHGCLMSYVGLIGSDVTPNYSDSNPSNITIGLWCSCRGTGRQETECEAFHHDFTHNTCLKNAIQSFGYGPEGGTLPATEPSATILPPAQPPIISKPSPALHGNAIKPMDSACMFSTCANLQVSSCGSTVTVRSYSQEIQEKKQLPGRPLILPKWWLDTQKPIK
ncbi:GDNF family receptor alpha-2 [Takifugu flavidus]|uniref:GDNF family receptor alpha-2 n=1 Tax=Takifugu flavidus TaxID=433684 RepID=A0A5C6NGE5_9TELE|nr:GDNF family receptor alpha-2 [Takifugu flavidus]